MERTPKANPHKRGVEDGADVMHAPTEKMEHKRVVVGANPYKGNAHKPVGAHSVRPQSATNNAATQNTIPHPLLGEPPLHKGA